MTSTVQRLPENETGQIEVRTLRSVAEVEALREPWTAWGGDLDSDIDRVLTIIESYSEALRPHVIAVYRDGRPDAILIGRLEQKRLVFRAGYLTVFRPSACCLTFVCGALRGNASPENARILIREVLASLKRGDADLAHLESVPTGLPLYEPALKMPGILSRDVLPPVKVRRVMTLPNNIEDVYRPMSGTRRKHLRSSERKLQNHAAGALRIVCYQQPSELERLFQDAEEIAKKTYQRGLGAGFADTPTIRKQLELAANKGWLRANLLYIGTRPIAFWIGILYGESFGSAYLGYDPEFRQFSPGMVLIMRVTNDLCRRAHGDVVKQVDFGYGDAEYKALLATGSWLEASIFLFSPTAKGLFLKSLRVLTRVVDLTARRIVASAGFIPKLKRSWRDRLSTRTQRTVAG